MAHVWWHAGGPLAPQKRGECGPQREGLGPALCGGAQVTAAVEAVEQVYPGIGPRGDLEFFSQVRRGGVGAARPQVQDRHPCQKPRLVLQIAHGQGPRQRWRTDTLGGGQVAGLDQHHRHDVTAPPGQQAGDVGLDLLGLPGHRMAPSRSSAYQAAMLGLIRASTSAPAVRIFSHSGRTTRYPKVPSGSSTRCRLNADTAFSGISRSIVPPMLATRARRSVSWWSSCRSRRVDSRANKIHLSWPGVCRCLSAANYRFGVNRQPRVHDAGYASVDRVS